MRFFHFLYFYKLSINILKNKIIIKNICFYPLIGDWGLGIGDWGLGIGPNPQSPIPNPHPQSPIPQG
jgi:hypothetical protein